MQILESIEKELETLKEQNKPHECLDNYDDIYQMGVHSGICRALALVYKIHIENIGK